MLASIYFIEEDVEIYSVRSEFRSSFLLQGSKTLWESRRYSHQCACNACNVAGIHNSIKVLHHLSNIGMPYAFFATGWYPKGYKNIFYHFLSAKNTLLKSDFLCYPCRCTLMLIGFHTLIYSDFLVNDFVKLLWSAEYEVI